MPLRVLDGNMKKAGNKRFEDFPAVKLYLDDLLDLVRILEESCEEVQIRTEDYDEIKPSEIEEVAASVDGNKFSNIYIQSYRPYISLELRTFGISAYISEDSLIQHGVISKFREIIEKRKKKYFNALTYIGWLIPMAVFGVSIAKSEWILAGMCSGLIFLMIWPIVKFQMAHKVVVLTTFKTNELSFFSRRKDDIAVAIGSALIGAIVSFILVKYLGQP